MSADQFLDAIRATGLIPPQRIEPGRIVRFPGLDKKEGNRAGWCRLFDDMQGGMFGDWSTGLSETWQAKRENPYTKDEQAAFRRRCAETRKAQQAEQAKVHNAAAKEAEKILSAATGDPVGHHYIKSKHIAPTPKIKRGAWPQRGWNDALLIPLFDSAGKLCTLEAINPNGEKDFLKGGRKRGCFHSIGNVRNAETILIGEGFATVAAVHMATEYPAMAAMDAGNLPAVAEAARRLAPNAAIVLLADNDIRGDGKNPGVEAATKAAKAVNGVVAVPELDGKKCDFWDLWNGKGPESIRKSLHLCSSEKFPDSVTDVTFVTHSARTREGHEILDSIEVFLSKFVAYPSNHGKTAHVLWIAHTHLMDVWDSTPRIAFLSPEPGSGKSRALEVTELLVPNPVEAVNVTPAYLFRKVGDDEDGRPTILYDEVDTVFGPRARENEELRGLLNAGHRKHSMVGRCVVQGRQVFTEETPAYCAVAMAGLGNLPDTILNRSVVIRMKRRAPGENVLPYRRRCYQNEGDTLRKELITWAANIANTITDEWPEMPCGVEDRDADVWESLLAIADAAGAEWPEKARQAAKHLVQQSKESTPSLGIRLLADLRTIFKDHDCLYRDTILQRLRDLDESPWANLRGSPIDAARLSRMLRKYDIKQAPVREEIGGRKDKEPRKGYRREDLQDAFDRYLPSLESKESVTSVTSVTNTDNEAKSSTENSNSVPVVTPVTHFPGRTETKTESAGTDNNDTVII